MTGSEHTIGILGSNVHYWAFNPDKPRTIVMIHGFRGTHHGLQDIIDLLPDYHIIIPDLPGFGESTPMSIRHDIAGYTNFVQQFIQKLKLDRPVLLGHSFGSIITASVAASSPQLISKLILVNAIALPALKGPRKLMSQATKLYYQLSAALPEKPGRALLSSKAVTQATSVLLAKTRDHALRADIHHHHQQHFSTFQTRQVLLESFDASIGHAVLDYAPHINMPTLLIAGAIDDIAPLQGQHALQRALPNAQLIAIPGVGHLIHYEKPKEAAETITNFLDVNA
jgi:pimeloyl-ACP methyl ester carboxylesterase